MTFREMVHYVNTVQPEGYKSLNYNLTIGCLSRGEEASCRAFVLGQHFDGPSWKVVRLRIEAYQAAMAVTAGDSKEEGAPE